jgi:hypothetical protein
VSWRGLRYKGTEILRSIEWNVAVDALNDLYGWLTDGTHDIDVNNIYANFAEFNTRPIAEGRPVILDGDPISIYQFYDLAKQQITEAIDKSSLLSKTVSDLDQIYGKLPSKEDVTSSIDSALITGYALDIREYARRTAETVETYAPNLATIEEYVRETRDVVVKLSIDEYGNVGVRIAEPLDEYGYVPVSTVYDRAGLAKDATLQLLTKALQSIGGDNVLIFIADSGIMVPVDIQARYKPPGITLYSGTVTSSGNTADIDVSLLSSMRIMVKVTSVSGTTPTLDVYIEGKYEATGDYVPLLSRTGITDTGVYELGQLDNLCFRYIRVRWSISGTSPSFTFGVYAQAMV